jgi:hypothetical protein
MMESADYAPPELPPIMPAMAAVTLRAACLQAVKGAPELSGVFFGPTGALLLIRQGEGLALQFGSLQDIADLIAVLGMVHDAHARREAFEAAEARHATVSSAGHA